MGGTTTGDTTYSIGRADRPYFSATNVQDLRHDKTAWLKDDASPAGANDIVSKYYKTAAYAGIPKDVILVPVPSTTGRNILPDALGVRISKDFGQVLETRRVGTATAAGEAKNKRTFFDKEADPVNFVPNEPVIAELQGKRVFITEDVHNTGESWIAFARMLQENGVEVVGIATLVSTEQRITSPRDMERMSEKMASLLSKPLDEVLAAVHSLFDGTYKQLFNKAEAEISRANERSNASNARKIFDIASSGRRAGAYSNPLRDRGQSEGGVSRAELSQDSFTFALRPTYLARIEAAIAGQLAAAPAERAAYYETLRNRLAALSLQLSDMEAGIGPFARKPTDAVGEERRRIQDAIAEARTVIGALPMEARGRVNIDFSDITGATSERGRANALVRLIEKADDALEIALKGQYLEAFETLMDLAKPDLRQNKSAPLPGKDSDETGFQQPVS